MNRIMTFDDFINNVNESKVNEVFSESGKVFNELYNLWASLGVIHANIGEFMNARVGEADRKYRNMPAHEILGIALSEIPDFEKMGGIKKLQAKAIELQKLDKLSESEIADLKARATQYKADLLKTFGTYVKNWYWDMNIMGFSWEEEINGIPVTFILRHEDEDEDIEETTLVLGVEETEVYLTGDAKIKKFLQSGWKQLTAAETPNDMDYILGKMGFTS